MVTVSRLARLIRRRGLAGGLKDIVVFAAGRVYTRHEDIVLLRELEPRRDGGPPPVGRPARASDLGSLRALARRNRSGEDARKLEDYLRFGYHGFVWEDGSELVGYIWAVDATSRPAHPHLARRGIELGPGDVYGFDLFVMPDHRGKGAAQAFLASFEAELAERGQRRMFGGVGAANTPARWLYALSGYREVRRIVSNELGGVILVCDGRVYVRNSRFGRGLRTDFRPLTDTAAGRAGVRLLSIARRRAA